MWNEVIGHLCVAFAVIVIAVGIAGSQGGRR